jgi:hypothetical protein
MMHRVSESLAGRILIKELFAFSLAELTDAEPDRVLSNISKEAVFRSHQAHDGTL